MRNKLDRNIYEDEISEFQILYFKNKRIREQTCDSGLALHVHFTFTSLTFVVSRCFSFVAASKGEASSAFFSKT